MPSLAHTIIQRVKKMWLTRFNNVEIGRGVSIGRGCTIKANQGTIIIGDFTKIRDGCKLRVAAKDARIILGSHCYLGYYSVIEAKRLVQIGNDVIIAEHVSIRDQDHQYGDKNTPIRKQGFNIREVSIGEDVWIGAKSSVMANIGQGSIIGGLSFVNQDIPEYSIAVGTPARVIKERPK